MVQGVEVMSSWAGLEVYLPNGKKLGVVLDAVLDAESMQCTHLFVRDIPEELVEGSIPLAVPWRWIRAIDEIVLLRWFPATPIPINS